MRWWWRRRERWRRCRAATGAGTAADAGTHPIADTSSDGGAHNRTDVGTHAGADHGTNGGTNGGTDACADPCAHTRTDTGSHARAHTGPRPVALGVRHRPRAQVAGRAGQDLRDENSYFMDGPSGTASYQIDVPNGGQVYLRGNLIHKGPLADNSTVIAYGAEGLGRWTTHTLTMVHNTITSTCSGGSFLDINAGVQAVTLSANLFAGTGGPAKISSGVAAGKITESNTLVSSAGNFVGLDNVASPNFWPNPALAAALSLGALVPDASYLQDSPAPFTLRPIDTSAPRRVGALRSAR